MHGTFASKLAGFGTLSADDIALLAREASPTRLDVGIRTFGLAVGERAQLPLTQMVLADALGLTPVHIKRVLGERGAMKLGRGMPNIPDGNALARIGID